MLELTSYVKVIKKSKPWGINIEGAGGGGGGGANYNFPKRQQFATHFFFVIRTFQ